MKAIILAAGIGSLVFGKPNSELLNPILEKYSPSELLIAGDRLYTDKVLAEKSGIDFALVLSGESKKYQVDGMEPFPAVILKNLGDISE